MRKIYPLLVLEHLKIFTLWKYHNYTIFKENSKLFIILSWLCLYLWELGFICSFLSLATSSGIEIIGDRRVASCPSPSPSAESTTALRKSEGEDSSFGMSFLWHQRNCSTVSPLPIIHPLSYILELLGPGSFFLTSAEGWTIVNTFMTKDQEETPSSCIDTCWIRMVWELYSGEWHRPSAA